MNILFKAIAIRNKSKHNSAEETSEYSVRNKNTIELLNILYMMI